MRMMVEHHANVPLYLHLNNQTILNKAKSGSLILHTLIHQTHPTHTHCRTAKQQITHFKVNAIRANMPIENYQFSHGILGWCGNCLFVCVGEEISKYFLKGYHNRSCVELIQTIGTTVLILILLIKEESLYLEVQCVGSGL